MARTPIPEVDSSAATIVGPLRDSFLRLLAAENRSPSTRITHAAAIDLPSAFTASAGMPELTEFRHEQIEAFLVDPGQRGQRPAARAPQMSRRGMRISVTAPEIGCERRISTVRT